MPDSLSELIKIVEGAIGVLLTRILLWVIALAMLVSAIWLIVSKGAATYRTVISWFRPRPKKSRVISVLYHIVPILEKMRKRNMELSKTKKDVKFRFDVITEDYVDILGYHLKASSIQDMAKQLPELKEHLNKIFPDNILDVDSSNILQLSSIYECMGLGLGKHRKEDKKYAKLVRKLDTYRNYVADTKLNELIQLYTYCSEAFSNFLLLNAIPETDKQFMQILPQDLRVSLQGGGAETSMVESMWNILTNISKRIKELEEAEK